MKTITTDAGKSTLRIGGGSLFSDVLAAIDALNITGAFPLGDCTSVGVTGYALSGGISVLTPALGLGLDTVIALDAVLPNGTIVLNISKDHHHDLFFALRGAGPNFAIVTSVTLQLKDVGDFMVLSQSLPASSLSGCILAASSFAHQFPGAARVDVSLNSDSSLLVLIAATNPEKVIGYLQSSNFSSNGTCPLNMSAVTVGPFWSVYRNHVSADVLPSYENYSSQLRDHFFTEEDAQHVAEVAQQMMGGMPANATGSFLVSVINGALNNFPLDSAAWAHRNAKFAIALYIFGSSVPTSLLMNQWMVRFFPELRKMGNPNHQAIYPNDVNMLIQDPLQAFYGVHLERLDKLKSEYDPGNRIRLLMGLRAKSKKKQKIPFSVLLYSFQPLLFFA